MQCGFIGALKNKKEKDNQYKLKVPVAVAIGLINKTLGKY